VTFLRREPPDAFEFLGAKRTKIDFWWRYLCPCCCAATVALIPSGRDGWRIASEIGCSRGCTAAEIDAWQAWRCGQAPPAAELDNRAHRYAMGAVRRILAELPEHPAREQLLQAAFRCGQFVAAAKLDPEPIIAVLADEASRAGVELEPIAKAMASGCTRPARLP
jgi:hypothetical protein